MSTSETQVDTRSGDGTHKDPQPHVPSPESEKSSPSSTRRNSDTTPADPLPFPVPTREGPVLRRREKDVDYKLAGNPQARTPADRTQTPKARTQALTKDRKAILGMYRKGRQDGRAIAPFLAGEG